MTFTPTPFRDDGKTKGSDWWNIILFVAVTMAMGYLFDLYIMKPREAAIAQANKAAAEAALLQAPNGGGAPALAPRPREEVVSSSARVTLKNQHITMTIPVSRARVDDLYLNGYYTALDHKTNIQLLSPLGTDHPVYTDTGWLANAGNVRVPDAESVWVAVPGATDTTASFTWDNGAGLVFTRTFTLDDQYLITVADRVKNNTRADVSLWPYALLSQTGVPENMQSGIVHEGAVGFVGNTYIEQSYRKWAKLSPAEGSYTAQNGWAGITSRYFFAGIIPDQTGEHTFRAMYQPPANPADKASLPKYQMDAMGPAQKVAAGAEGAVTTHLFMGPKKLGLLEAYEKSLGLKHFDLVMDFGWFYFLTKPFYYALVAINDVVHNFGVTIILFTCLLRLAVFPLANTSFKSFAKMKKVGPQVQELQKKYASDKQKMQQELVKLYQTEKVNPLSGCLPILAQIPIFFAMYKIINVSIEMRQAPFFGWIHDLSAPDPTSILNLFGLLPFDVHSFFHFGVWPTFLFVMIMLQVRMSPPPPDKMMKVFFNYYYPVMVCFTMSKFAAGLVIYWAFSAFLSVAQQMIIMKRMGVPIHLFELFRAKKDGDEVVVVDEKGNRV